MKKIKYSLVGIAFLLMFLAKANAQNMTNYNLYLQNPVLYNPAYTIDDVRIKAFVNSHIQWIDFEGAPRINTFGAYFNPKDNMGFGLSVVNATQGITTTNNFVLSYAYKAKFADEHYLNLGIGLGAMADKLNVNDIEYSNMTDPTINSNPFEQTTFRTSFGLAYVNKNVEFQVMMPQLYERKKMDLYTIASLAYNYQANDAWDLKPVVMMRGVKTSPMQFDFSVMATYMEKLIVQGGYRTNNSFIAGVGLMSKNYSLAYAYQLENSYISNAAKGTHEIQLVLRLNKKEKQVKEEKEELVSGNLKSKDNGTPLDAHMKVVDSKGNVVYDGDVKGSFEMKLLPGKYTAYFTGNKILNKTEKFEVKAGKDVFLSVDAKEVNPDRTFDLGIVNFETSKSVIKDESSYQVLDKLVDILKEYTDLTVEIAGHTDNVGDADANMKLSQSRANVCRDYVISKGIDGSRIKAVGYGQTKPIVENDTPENRAKNRRTEFKIVD